VSLKTRMLLITLGDVKLRQFTYFNQLTR